MFDDDMSGMGLDKGMSDALGNHGAPITNIAHVDYDLHGNAKIKSTIKSKARNWPPVPSNRKARNWPPVPNK